MNLVNIVIEALKNSILITGLVMVMMLLIEYVNVHSHGSTFNKLRNSPVKQVLLSALLGLVPGCVGGFAVVSLYTHNIVSFGSLLAMMISSSGDEAFVLLAAVPKTALILFFSLFITGLVIGVLADKVFKDRRRPFAPEHYKIHENEYFVSSSPIFSNSIRENLKKLSKERLIIVVGVAIFVIAVVMGILEHDHIETGASGETHSTDEHLHGSINIFSERWINLLFAGISIITLYLTLKAKEHFIKEHLWNHVIVNHFKSIFLWTFGALIVIHFGTQYLHIENWVRENVIIMILMAAAIGLIPESGPHMIFITLFANGLIPFSVLFVSSMVQDGHTALPLLAESKGSFFKAKAINFVAGITIGITMHLFGI